MKFSVVIPARNERRDIGETLDALLAQEHTHLEVIVIDDGSTDGTPELVLERVHRDARVRLLRTRVGSAAASRNLGIDEATGDVIVFVDADVVVAPDFLVKLADVYAQGADLVSVESRVPDTVSVISRFQQATHVDLHGSLRGVGFSQAFSCRTEAARATRFPTTMPGCGGEDGAFHERLVAARYEWKRAPWLLVDHHVPDRVASLVRQWAGRGRSAAYVDLRLRGIAPRRVAARRAVAGMRDLLRGFCVVLPLLSAVRRSAYSPRGRRDVAAFAALYTVVAVARGAGEWQGAIRAWRERT